MNECNNKYGKTKNPADVTHLMQRIFSSTTSSVTLSTKN